MDDFKIKVYDQDLEVLTSGQPIPGVQGLQGPEGPVGPIGPEGPVGATGATGATGPTPVNAALLNTISTVGPTTYLGFPAGVEFGTDASNFPYWMLAPTAGGADLPSQAKYDTTNHRLNFTIDGVPTLGMIAGIIYTPLIMPLGMNISTHGNTSGYTDATLFMGASDTTKTVFIVGAKWSTFDKARWRITLGDNTAESGSNAGSDFKITPFNDAGSGTGLTTAMFIKRSTGATTFNSTLGGVIIGAPTGLDKGTATLNAATIYENGTLLSAKYMALGVLAGVNTQTASYTLALTDIGKVVEINNASANTLTVPPNSSVAFAIGTRIDIEQYGAGQTTITPGAGVTIRSSGGKTKTAAQYAVASLYKRATDEWVLRGDITT